MVRDHHGELGPWFLDIFRGAKLTPKSGACFGSPGKAGLKPLLFYEGGPKIRAIFGSNFGSRLGRVVFVFGARTDHLARIEFQRQPATTSIFSVGHDLVPQGGKNNHDGYHAHWTATAEGHDPVPLFCFWLGARFRPPNPTQIRYAHGGKAEGGRRRKGPEGENREGHGGEGEEQKEADENNGNEDKRWPKEAQKEKEMRKEHFEKDNKRSDKRVPQVVNLHRAGPLRVPVSLPFSACGSSISTARVRCGSQIQLNFQLAGPQSSLRGSTAGLLRVPVSLPFSACGSSIFTARVRCGSQIQLNFRLAGPQSPPRGSAERPSSTSIFSLRLLNLHRAGPLRVRCGSQIQLNFQLAAPQSSPRGSATGANFHVRIINLHRAGPLRRLPGPWSSPRGSDAGPKYVEFKARGSSI